MQKINKIFKRIIYTIAFCSFCSCSEFDEKTVVGTYEKDKFAYREEYANINSAIIESEYPLLSLHSDKTFELKEYDGVTNIIGTWKIAKIHRWEKEIVIEFDYNDKKIKGTLRGNIFYFYYPNDFQYGKHDVLLYVKHFQ